MLKKGQIIIFLSACLIFFIIGGVFAQEGQDDASSDQGKQQQESEEQEADVGTEDLAEADDDVRDTGGDIEEDSVGEDTIDEKVTICHIPAGERSKANTISIGKEAVESHLAHGDYEGECEEEFEGDIEEELGGAGLTPDSAFYFLDELFDGFGNCIDNRGEKVAEIKEMVNAGKMEEAKESLRKYGECADEVENEVSPEEKERVKRSARAIRKVVRDIEKDIPDEDKEEFSGIINKERKREAAAEIASKIKELCVQLSKLDPVEYARVCRTKDNAPRWQIELDEDLTDEQRDAARKFGEVMSQCFRTQGRECRCGELDEINKPFADRCSIVAPLAAKCDDGDENACEAMDDVTEGIEDLLPDYLLDIFDEFEGDVAEDRFEFHMPIECREARVKSPQDCMNVMIDLNAPPECKQVLKERKVKNEREAREICEEIMFKEYADPRCIEKGIKNPRDCGALIFREEAPPECIEAGLTGEHPSDGRECGELMNSKGREGREFGGPDCRGIQNSEERLRCYDNALEGIGGPGGAVGFGGREGRGHWPLPCEEAKAFTRESCEKIMIESSQKRYEETKRYEESFAGECRAKGGRWDCSFGDITSDEPCRCFIDEEERFGGEREDRERSYREEYENRYREFRSEGEFRPPEGFHPPEGEFRPPENFATPEGAPAQTAPPTESQPSSSSTESSGSSQPGGTSGSSGSSESSGGTTSGTSETSSGGTTGSVIASDNRFLDFYYWS